MQFDLASLSNNQRYHLMTQVVIPRPIAWVLTDNGAGDASQPSYNLAPFSYFNAISSDPPLVMLSVGHKPDGQIKDTRANIVERKHLVIHIPSGADAEAVTASAASLAHGESEVDRLGLPLLDQHGWPLPRLSQCRVAILAHFYELQEIGPQKQGLLFCCVDKVFVDDDLVSEDNKGRATIDASQIAPLSRLGANEYALLGEILSRKRPK